MSGPTQPLLTAEYHPLTPERWTDFEALFGEHGAYGGCWCMWWRITRAQFSKQAGEGNRLALKGTVKAGEVPGILAYVEGTAVAWCSLGPRESSPALNRSRTLKRVDDQPVWSIVCFYVARSFRRQGLMEALVRAARLRISLSEWSHSPGNGHWAGRRDPGRGSLLPAGRTSG